MAADEKPKEQVAQAERARKWNLKHKVSFSIRIVVEFRAKTPECISSHPKTEQVFDMKTSGRGLAGLVHGFKDVRSWLKG